MFAIDVENLFPESENGDKYIVVMMHHFSNWTETYEILESLRYGGMD